MDVKKIDKKNQKILIVIELIKKGYGFKQAIEMIETIGIINELEKSN